MKKMFLLLMAVAMFASAFGLQVGMAQADGSLIVYEGSLFVWGKGIVFQFDAEGYRNKDVKNATIHIGSDFYDLFCWVLKEEGKIVCNAQGGLTQFAGETGIIYLGGQIFYVIIPGRAGAPEESEESFTCESGVPGADVTFFTSDETLETYFISGSTLAEVQDNAENWLGGYLISIVEIGELYCGQEPD